MLIDLLSTDNLANYNIKIAQVMGLHSAIYINELINISNKATLISVVTTIPVPTHL